MILNKFENRPQYFTRPKNSDEVSPARGIQGAAARRLSARALSQGHDLTKHDRFYSRNSFIEFLTLDEVSTPRLMTQRAAVERTNDLGWLAANQCVPSHHVLALRGLTGGWGALPPDQPAMDDQRA